MARPCSREADIRRNRFLTLLAAGVKPREARLAARIDPDRALTIACEADFQQLVAEIRAGRGPTLVELAQPQEQAA